LVPFVEFKNIELAGIKGVLTDLDNTLYSYNEAHKHALRYVYGHVSQWGTLEEFLREYRCARDEVTARLKGQGACRSRLFAFQLLSEEKGESAPFLKAAQLDDLYWSSFMSSMTIDADAADFLKRCQLAHIPVCVVTNMTARVQIEKLRKLNIAHLINHLVTSEEIGIEKPSPIIFKAGLKKLGGISANEALMVGDDLNCDIEGAQIIGLRTAYVRPR
jgi:putative hydrolase of the HAD superfamily